MLSCAGADRLQTGMRGAFGKPQGTVARVHIGQIIMSARGRDHHLANFLEAFKRAKMKFPGRQKVRCKTRFSRKFLKKIQAFHIALTPRSAPIGMKRAIHVTACNLASALNFHFSQFPPQIAVSQKWGFTRFERSLYEKYKANGRVVPDGATCKYVPDRGPLEVWRQYQLKFHNLD